MSVQYLFPGASQVGGFKVHDWDAHDHFVDHGEATCVDVMFVGLPFHLVTDMRRRSTKMLVNKSQPSA